MDANTTTGTCIGCGDEVDAVAVGAIGDEAGDLCVDCAYWLDGNVAG